MMRSPLSNLMDLGTLEIETRPGRSTLRTCSSSIIINLESGGEWFLQYLSLRAVQRSKPNPIDFTAPFNASLASIPFFPDMLLFPFWFSLLLAHYQKKNSPKREKLMEKARIGHREKECGFGLIQRKRRRGLNSEEGF